MWRVGKRQGGAAGRPRQAAAGAAAASEEQSSTAQADSTARRGAARRGAPVSRAATARCRSGRAGSRARGKNSRGSPDGPHPRSSASARAGASRVRAGCKPQPHTCPAGPATARPCRAPGCVRCPPAPARPRAPPAPCGTPRPSRWTSAGSQSGPGSNQSAPIGRPAARASNGGSPGRLLSRTTEKGCRQEEAARASLPLSRALQEHAP